MRTSATLLFWILAGACADAGEELEELARKGASCEDASDCCAVVDDCGATAYVVGTADYQRARELSAEAEREEICAGCTPPFVEVICLQGTCTGVAFQPDRLPWETDHCGALLDTPPEGAPQVTLSCE